MRTQEGWQFGAKRDDGRREHPSLVPFEELSEAEKNYDRQMVLGTLEELQSLGYEIKSGPGVGKTKSGEPARLLVGRPEELPPTMPDTRPFESYGIHGTKTV